MCAGCSVGGCDVGGMRCGRVAVWVAVAGVEVWGHYCVGALRCKGVACMGELRCWAVAGICGLEV